jgi:hypothetical protein
MKRVREVVPDDVLVLPAHGKPLRGLHARINHLIEGHEMGQARLLALLEKPHRAADVFPALFRREIEDDFNRMLAVGEALAHLMCLAGRGLALPRTDADGVVWWQKA